MRASISASSNADIAGHDEPVGKLHDERRVVAAAIGIDQEPRVAREQGRRAERPARCSVTRGGADVVGDVPVQVLGREAEGAVGAREWHSRRGRRE